MKNRIKEVRLHIKKEDGSKLTQQEFADELGLAKATVTAFETGNRIPADSVVKLICNKYGINETWLLTGEGDMTAPASKEQEIAQITATLFKEGEDSFRYKLVKLASQMSDEQIKMCKELIKKLSE